MAEIAIRCGVKPSIAEIYVEFPGNDSAYCHVTALDVDISDSEKKRVKQFWSPLGLDSSGYRRFETSDELDAALDNALAVAPRSRSR